MCYLKKEMLESDVVVGVVVSMLVPEAAEHDQLEGDQDDLEELDEQLPGGLAPGDELPHGIHEEEDQVATEPLVGVVFDVAGADSGVVERRRLRNVDVSVARAHALVQEVPGNETVPIAAKTYR